MKYSLILPFLLLSLITTVRAATHIVMDSKTSVHAEGEWIELLLHEACHHLISSSSGFVGGTILDVSDIMGKKAPRQLWHSFLFYFSGKVAQNLLTKEEMKECELYMVRRNVFAAYFPLLDKHLPAYLANEANLAEATEKIMEDYYR